MGKDEFNDAKSDMFTLTLSKRGLFSQEEIESLLIPVNKSCKNIKDFEKFLTKRILDYEKPHGLFEKNIPVCRFSDSQNNKKLLKEIKRINEEQEYGNYTVPNTNITLINYSFCHNCRTIFTFKELVNYYSNPIPDRNFVEKTFKYKCNTGLCCKNCGTYFLPSLIISDGMAKNEV